MNLIKVNLNLYFFIKIRGNEIKEVIKTIEVYSYQI
jgi:hypothetical protein